MKLIAGLGNPGEKYELTRHNIGFLIIDHIARSLNIKLDVSRYSSMGNFFKFQDEEFFLMKPMTYMNNSGEAIYKFIKKHKIETSSVLIIVDDFNIPLGTIRVRRNGTDGGHNGLSSIIFNLETEEFPRMRVGIGPDELLNKEYFIDFVLSDFSEGELRTIEKMMPYYKDCVFNFITDGITPTMNKYNKSFLSVIEDNPNPDTE